MGLDAASRRSPQGLPCGAPGPSLASSAGSSVTCGPRGTAWSGCARSTGCPSPSVQDQAAARRYDLRSAACEPGIRARLAVHSWTRPDSAGHNKARPTPLSILVRGRFAGWRVKDSNLGRHQPTDLQSGLICISSGHNAVYEQALTWSTVMPRSASGSSPSRYESP